MERLRTRLAEASIAAGLSGYGIASADPFDEVRADLEERKQVGLAGKLAFTYRDPHQSTDVRQSFDWAQSLVVAAHSYVPEAGSPGAPDGALGRVSRFATEDHYLPLRSGLAQMAEILLSAGYRAEVLADDSRLVDRAAAVRAGIGWWGKNTMVISPKYGPWLLLGSVVTDAPLPPSTPMRRSCGTCDACLPACPTGALIEPGVLDATQCIAYWAQTPGVIPRHLRSPWSDRIYGCDDCLDACPPGHRRLEQAPTAGRVDLSWLLQASDEELLESFIHWYIPRRDPDYLRRNALVALGNVGSRGHIPVLTPYLNHGRATLRIHAAWALGRVGESAFDSLRLRLAEEHDPAVREEITTALAQSS